MMLFTLWSLHAESRNSKYISDKLEWRSSSSILKSSSKHISPQDWQFDYEATERTLFKIKLKKNGELLLNAHTAKILEQAVSELPLGMTKEALQRVQLLVAKGLPGKAGQQLASILIKFYHFQQASSTECPAFNPTLNKYDKARSFQQTVLRQECYLGKTLSQQLFGQKNALTHYLYARQHINEDSTLRPAQKQQQLMELKDRFKAHD